MTMSSWARGVVFGGLIVSAAASMALVSPRHAVTASTTETWIEVVERALARGDMSAAIYSWRNAYGEAWRSRRWEALLAVGDAALQIDRASRARETFRPEARRAYLEALFRARAVASDEGIRRLAAAFADLGDTEMAARVGAMAPQSSAKQAER